MVHRVESICRGINVEFNGWNSLGNSVTFAFTRGSVMASLTLDRITLSMINDDEFSKRIVMLFDSVTKN